MLDGRCGSLSLRFLVSIDYQLGSFTIADHIQFLLILKRGHFHPIKFLNSNSTE
jgi:hypothetical protein